MTFEILLQIVLLGIGLSMDAFSVALVDGLTMRGINKSRSFFIAGSFGFMQGFMPLVGFWIVELVESIAGNLAGEKAGQITALVVVWLAFVLLLIVGGKMLIESIIELRKPQEEKEENIYPVDIELKLKVGSRVMFTRNTNDFKNGTMGRVIALDDNYICVEKDDGEKIDVEKATWEKVDYYIDDTNQLKKHVKGTFTQYPLKLAWAISIHKSQGLTLDEVAIDAEKCFAAGQVYVALSRCKTLNGIHLLSPITKESIKVDKNVKQFMQSYGKE